MHKKTIWNLSLNALIVALEIVGMVLLFTLPLYLYDKEIWYGWKVIKFYTTDSNWLLMIASIISIICILLLHYKKIKKIPNWVKYFKLFATASTTLTMLAVLVFSPLSYQMGYGNPAGLYSNSNTFYHLLCPLTAIVNYLIFEYKSDIKFINTLYGMIPTAIYAIFYLSMSLSHIQLGNIIPVEYDWYGLSNIGIRFWPLMTMLAIGSSYLFTWCLWYGNKKIVIKQIEK